MATDQLSDPQRNVYIDRLKKLNHMLSNSNKHYFQQKSELFNCVNELFHKKKTTSLPSHNNEKELSDRIANFFPNKMKDIHDGL